MSVLFPISKYVTNRQLAANAQQIENTQKVAIKKYTVLKPLTSTQYSLTTISVGNANK